jgi:hypothetical protein
MDATRFDALTRSLATPAPRRGALRLLVGGLVGGLLVRRGQSPVIAAQPLCAQLGEACNSDDQCCVGYCSQDGFCACVADSEVCYPSGYGGCCNGQPCNAQGFCGGACGDIGAGCNSDVDCCQGNFPALCCFSGVSLTTVCTDVSNTGYVCPGDAPVAAGCPAGQTDCGGSCVDLSSHAGHCGACFNSCPLGGTCQGGVCGGVLCGDGLTDCGGFCVDLASDELHCGACYTSCPLGGYCAGGVCGGLICEDGLVACYGRCVDLYTDWSNCGACGTGCFEGTVCMEGNCIDRGAAGLF